MIWELTFNVRMGNFNFINVRTSETIKSLLVSFAARSACTYALNYRKS